MKRTVMIAVILLLMIPLGQKDSWGLWLFVPSEYSNIQAAINASNPGDEVVVADGLYTGFGNFNLNFQGKAITVRSENLTPETCIINCQGGSGDRRGFYFRNDEGPGAVVAGFTIRNGLATNGGAIRCEQGASPTITNCIFSNNLVFSGGSGGAIIAYSDVTVDNCYFTSNSAWSGGGGALFVASAKPRITNNSFYDNGGNYGGSIMLFCTQNALVSGNRITHSAARRGGCIYTSYSEDDTITGNDIIYNWAYEGGGIYVEQCTSLTLTGNVIVRNEARTRGGGIGVREYSTINLIRNTIANNRVIAFNGSGGGLSVGMESSAAITNTIFWENSAAIGPAIAAAEATGNRVVIGCSNVEGSEAACFVEPGSTLLWGDGNIDSEPLFCDTFVDDYRLYDFSDCTAGAQQSCGRIGAHDVGCTSEVVSVSLTCVPTSGTLAFETSLSIELTNLCPYYFRRIGSRIDFEMANGMTILAWKHGYMSLDGGETFTRTLPIQFPARSAVVGENRFRLVGEDVTRAPYNQPPYWPSGETDTDRCTVTAAWPEEEPGGE